MKRAALVVGAFLFVGVAWALPARLKYEMASCPSGLGTACIAAQACTANSCTGSAPTASTEGMSIGGVTAFRLTICAASGQTLAGAGTMQAYAYNSGEGVWSRNPGLDQTVSVTSTSCTGTTCRCQTFPDLAVGGQFDRVRFVASGVTVSLGDGTHKLDVLIDGMSYAR